MKLLRSVFSIVIISASLSCTDEPQVNADFTFSLTGDCSTPVIEVVFENTSTFASSYMWDFGDGTTSVESNPTKIYPKAGVYNVTLTASSDQNNSVKVQQVGINRNSDGLGPSAEFIYELLNPTSRLYQITISNYSASTNYLIDFGDGTKIIPSTASINHQFPGPSTYTVFLQASNEEGQSCFAITLNP